MTRLLLVGLIVALSGHAFGDSPVTAKKPSRTCPQTRLGNPALQAQYKMMWEKYSADVEKAN